MVASPRSEGDGVCHRQGSTPNMLCVSSAENGVDPIDLTTAWKSEPTEVVPLAQERGQWQCSQPYGDCW